MSRVRLIPIVIIVLITLAILVAGYQTYRHLNFINPLQTKIEQNSAVKSVQIASGTPAVIHISLKSVQKLDKHDLQTTYHNLTTLIQDTTDSNVKLDIVDNRDTALSQDYEQMQPILYQGIRNGTYLQMISQIKQQSTKLNIQSQITMDAHNVYVELWDSPTHYLYDVISYQVSQGGAAT